MFPSAGVTGLDRFSVEIIKVQEVKLADVIKLKKVALISREHALRKHNLT